MSTSSISPLSNSFLQSILNQVQHPAPNPLSTSPLTVIQTRQPQDNSQLSPFARVASALQQLQQSNPAEFKQITQQISTNLQAAAQTATADGNTTAATQLSQLATDFSTASTSGQIPNLQDLAQATHGAGGHHHHHFHTESALSDSGSTTSTTSNSTTQTASQLLSAFSTGAAQGAAQNEALNPASIILNTLSTAGINV
jgi:HSP90 family molecular chaperone